MIVVALLLLLSVYPTEQRVISNLIWPRDRVGREQFLTQVKVSLILPVELPKLIPNDTKLLTSLNRVGPGILSGFLEADRRGLLDNVYLNITARDSRCDNIRSPLRWTNAVLDKVNVVFGPSCEFSLAPVARQVQFHNVSLLTAGGMAWGYSDQKNRRDDEFYMLTRTGYNFLDTAKMISSVMEEMNWSRLIIIYRKTDRASWSGYLTCSHVMSAVVEEMKKKQVTVQEIKLDMTDKMYNNSADMLTDRLAELNYSISVVCASKESVRDIMLAADQLGILDSGQYVFINTDILTGYRKDYRPWHSDQSTNEENARAKRAFSSVLTATVMLNRTLGWSRYREECADIAKELFDDVEDDDDDEDNPFAANLHDAAILYSQALHETMVEEGVEGVNNQEGISRRMYNRTIHGITGPVIMNWNGDRGSTYAILQQDRSAGVYKPVRIYSAQEAEGSRYKVVDRFSWPNSESVPLDFPPCGFYGVCEVEESSYLTSILLGVMTTLLVVFFISAVFIYRHFKAEAEIASMTWKVNPDNILPTKECRGKFGSKSSIYQSMTVSQDSIYCEDSRRQIFVKTVHYKNNVVAYKRLYTEKINTQDRSLLLELKRLKDLHNNNLARFVGACLEPDNSFVLTEYCPRGSLQDILEDDMELDSDFRFSLIYDIVRGMDFLHSSDIKIHGNLKSSNCVVDSRFMVKLTDFGLLSLRIEEEIISKDHDNEYWKRMLWTAPELLFQNQATGTQEADVYSFSIILHEIAVQKGAWGINDNGWDPQYVVQGIQTEQLRPPLDFEMDFELVPLLERCWTQDPHQRPGFPAIKADVKKLNKTSTSSNIMDNLLSRMERYATNLEALVEERTLDYYEEKRKCEKLLYQLLPQPVALSLIEGKSVQAESFKCVTIYFSDIVGFTKISAESSPMQVVNLLNKLYTCFDSIIGNFNVYKVETIGDAYVVVSGLPVVHDQHARAIAGMSISILKSVATFKIPHMKEEQLKLRIGIHSGPCCAGVVGIKMPRYCLFGDTVNTASRMESNGSPLRIHISERTKELLEGMFVMEERGEIDIKGKGKMKTYWLIREEKNYSNLQTEYMQNSGSVQSRSLETFPTLNHSQHLQNIPNQTQAVEGVQYNKPTSAFNTPQTQSQQLYPCQDSADTAQLLPCQLSTAANISDSNSNLVNGSATRNSLVLEKPVKKVKTVNFRVDS